MTEHPSLTKPFNPDVATESLAVAKEFLDCVQPIVDSRRKLKETEEEVKGLLTMLLEKFDTLEGLKKENLVLEKSVLEQIQRKLQ